MKLKIAVLAGDGIGPEISEQGVAVMEAVCRKFGHEVSFTPALCGAAAIDAVGDPFPEETFRICQEADAVLFSAVGDPKFDNDPTAKVRPEQGLLAMRKKLGLFANIRPVETFDCLIHKSPLREDLVKGADFVCIRELTGGMYFGQKQEGTDYAFDTNAYSREEVERILHVAYQYARRRRKHLTVVDKANVLASSRLWRKVAGVVDESDKSPLDAAKRELWEETGYGGGEWRLLAKIAPNPGAMNNLCYCFVAEGVEKISDQHLEKTEDIAVHLMSEKEVKREMTNGGFMQALMLAPLYKYMYESR